MTKRVAILQSNYIPWKGYFDIIDRVDEFVLLDDVQYTRRDWRNRNQIKTPNGPMWLSIPIKNKGQFENLICNMETEGNAWREKHWQSILHSYRKAPHFNEIREWLEPLYLQSDETHLSTINHSFILACCDYLGIHTSIIWSNEITTNSEDKTDRLFQICRQRHADVYLSGPAAKDYLNTELFNKHGINVEWMSYEGYRKYPQLHGDFNHYVSVIDVLVHTGKQAADYIRRT